MFTGPLVTWFLIMLEVLKIINICLELQCNSVNFAFVSDCMFFFQLYSSATMVLGKVVFYYGLQITTLRKKNMVTVAMRMLAG